MGIAVYAIRHIICTIIKRINILFSSVVLFAKKIISVANCMVLICRKQSENAEALPLKVYYSDNYHKVSFQGFKYNTCICDLSIIIPVYNAANYIDICIESILNQKTDYSYEVIIIDDGSTDDSISHIEKYSKNDKIRFFGQSNLGQSTARNSGIYNSLGKYLMFVDSDDLLMPNAIEALMSTAESTNSDITEGSIVRFYKEITDEMIYESKGKNHIESDLKNKLFVLTTYGYSVAKIFKRELWKSLRYPEGYIFEDIITKFILRRKANQVAFIEDVVYGYRQNNQSSSHGSNHFKKLDSIWVLPRVFELCKFESVPRDDIFYLLSLNHIGMLNYITVKQQKREIKISCFAEMRKQLLSLQDCRPKSIPFMFRLLERSILENNIDAWEYIADTINKYKMLKNWREIN